VVLDLLETAGHVALFVGGCVRDTLAGLPVKDIDIATDARPDTVQALAEAAGVQAVPTGIEHGTVTLVVRGMPFEVTTFRLDVETDGRRAVVAFSDRIEEDALRRDLTINALYADREGRVIDPVGTGVRDLEQGLVRFVGNAETRIREDYLRSLRYFRFLARFGDPEAGVDAEALSAIAGNLDGLETLAAERVGHEMRRLLGTPDPAPALAAMEQSGALARVLPGADVTALAPLVHLERDAGVHPHWPRRLVAIGGEDVTDRFRLSRTETRELKTLGDAISSAAADAELGYRYGSAAALDAALIRQAMAGQPISDDTAAEIERGAQAEFPVTSADLMPGLQGPALGEKLGDLERHWIASDFTLSKEQLLAP
jgi:poly(A) polymerase